MLEDALRAFCAENEMLYKVIKLGVSIPAVWLWFWFLLDMLPIAKNKKLILTAFTVGALIAAACYLIGVDPFAVLADFIKKI